MINILAVRTRFKHNKVCLCGHLSEMFLPLQLRLLMMHLIVARKNAFRIKNSVIVMAFKTKITIIIIRGRRAQARKMRGTCFPHTPMPMAAKKTPDTGLCESPNWLGFPFKCTLQWLERLCRIDVSLSAR